jgi:hypothetical protein
MEKERITERRAVQAVLQRIECAGRSSVPGLLARSAGSAPEIRCKRPGPSPPADVSDTDHHVAFACRRAILEGASGG